MKLTGAQALIKSLEMEGTEVCFGLPGGAILPAYDPIIDSPIRHILVRHEQGAGHMAEGYAHVTGRPGVAIVTSGPAATNIVTPLCDAYMDSVPIVVITGQVSRPMIGTDGFQECDTVGITRSVTKHNELVMNPEDITMAIRQAFHIATTGRPGPVLVDLPKDVLQASTEWNWPTDAEIKDSLPGYRPTMKGHPRMIKEAARYIAESRRPVIYAGGGILNSHAAAELRELAELTGIHVVTTLMARGAFPDSHPLCLGMPGMHGNYTAITAMQQADLLIALGSRFDDRVTGRVGTFAPDAKIIHVDIDPAELGKIRRPDVPIVGDARLVIEQLVLEVRALRATDAEAAARQEHDRGPWNAQIAEWQAKFPLHYDAPEDGDLLKPQYVLEVLRDSTPDDTIVVSGVGQHQMWTSQYWRFEHPYTWVNSGGLGTMGFAVPAAIGAKVGRPDRMVWAVDGDGCFQMTAQELVTASSERIPVKIAILNNAYLGMVRQWQEMFYDERYSEVYLSPDLPDYVKWAEAMGCVGFRVETPEEVQPTIDKANEIDDRPVVIDFRTDAREKVFPMVPAGASNDDVVVHPAQQHGGRGRGWSSNGRRPPARHHTLSVLVENKFGVLARVSGMFARRGYNIFSLAVAPTDDERFSRITIVVDAEQASVEQMVKQLFKLINVVKITELGPSESVERELLLLTVEADASERGQVIELLQILDGKIVDVGHETLTLMVADTPAKLDDFEDLMRPFGITELQRTGRVALPKLDKAAPRPRTALGKVG